MKILIISDIHGNLPALEHALKMQQDADFIISLGDVVNYGPWSNECVDLLNSLPHKILLKGNHEQAFIEGKYPGENIIVRQFFEHCIRNFSRVEEIRNYQEEYYYLDALFTHTIQGQYIFIDSEVKFAQSTFIGHSHRMFLRYSNEFFLVNVGSVGQNRTNIDEINFAVWYPDKQALELKTYPFKADLLLSEMRSQYYPVDCLKYILEKRRSDSEY